VSHVNRPAGSMHSAPILLTREGSVCCCWRRVCAAAYACPRLLPTPEHGACGSFARWFGGAASRRDHQLRQPGRCLRQRAPESKAPTSSPRLRQVVAPALAMS
jgi:hypothetical protein